MAAKAKTEKGYKPAHAAPQHAKRRTDTRKIVKALIFGPTIAILGVTLIYFAWWGLSKAFTALHTVITAHFVPWVGANWPIIVGIWAMVALTSGLYYFYEQYQKNKKDMSKEQPVKKNQPAHEQPELKPKRKAPTSTIFDAKADTEFFAEELENVGAYPHAPISKAFSTRVEIPEGFEEFLDKMYDSKIPSNQETKNPDNLISLGNPSSDE